MRTSGGGGAETVNGIIAVAVRVCASVIVAVIDFAPTLVPAATVAVNEKMLSPAIASPFDPSSKNVWVADPPIAVRLAATARPVLAGPEPGVTVTVSSEDAPGSTDEGLDAPTPEGFVVAPPPHEFRGEVVFRGAGVTTVKSVKLLSVSAHPPEMRWAAVVLLRTDVGRASAHVAVGPKATKSITEA